MPIPTQPSPTPPVRLIASDVDGTLVTTDHRISAAVRDAVAEATRAGVSVVLASARAPLGMRHLVEELDLLDVPGAPLAGCVVAFQGALVGQFHADGTFTELHSTRLDPEVARSIVAQVTALGHVVNWYDGPGWFPSTWDAYGELEQKSTRQAPAGLLGPAQLAQGAPGPHKLMVPPAHGRPDLVPGVVAALPGGCDAFLSGEGYLEIVGAGVDKSTGLDQLVADLGITRAETAAVGDGPNDLGMFAHAGTSVAMANASAAVRSQATWVTSSNDDDGLAQAIRVLLGG